MLCGPTGPASARRVSLPTAALQLLALVMFSVAASAASSLQSDDEPPVRACGKCSGPIPQRAGPVPPPRARTEEQACRNRCGKRTHASLDYSVSCSHRHSHPKAIACHDAVRWARCSCAGAKQRARTIAHTTTSLPPRSRLSLSLARLYRARTPFRRPQRPDGAPPPQRKARARDSPRLSAHTGPRARLRSGLGVVSERANLRDDEACSPSSRSTAARTARVPLHAAHP